ncbi:unnamed protein product [Brassica oleracea]|uniref:Uncharacterized protein n=2 Tax=Brassica TaxID=3705 RepID=A0A3P6DZ06_BRAOL|nr:unnamed protein product [Brassica oleracea]
MGRKWDNIGEIGSLVNDSSEPSSSKEKSLEIANVPEDKFQNRVVNLSFLYWTNEYPIFQMYSRGKLEGRKRRMLLWYTSVERVCEQGNFLPHNNLLLRETTLPN